MGGLVSLGPFPVCKAGWQSAHLRYGAHVYGILLARGPWEERV